MHLLFTSEAKSTEVNGKQTSEVYFVLLTFCILYRDSSCLSGIELQSSHEMICFDSSNSRLFQVLVTLCNQRTPRLYRLYRVNMDQKESPQVWLANSMLVWAGDRWNPSDPSALLKVKDLEPCKRLIEKANSILGCAKQHFMVPLGSRSLVFQWFTKVWSLGSVLEWPRGEVRGLEELSVPKVPKSWRFSDVQETKFCQPAMFLANCCAVSSSSEAIFWGFWALRALTPSVAQLEKLRLEKPEIVERCSATAGLSLGECAIFLPHRSHHLNKTLLWKLRVSAGTMPYAFRACWALKIVWKWCV